MYINKRLKQLCQINMLDFFSKSKYQSIQTNKIILYLDKYVFSKKQF